MEEGGAGFVVVGDGGSGLERKMKEKGRKRKNKRKRSISWNSRTKLRPSDLKSCSIFKGLGSSNLAFISSFDWIIFGLVIKKFGFVRFWVVLSY